MTPDQYRMCYHFARRLGMQHEDAQDITQDVALRALLHMPASLSNAEQRAWLVTVLRNKLYSDWRAMRSKLRVEHLIDFSDTQQCRTLDQIELDQRIEQLATLKPTHSECLIRTANGETIDQIAAAIGIPTGTVKSRTARAREALALQD